MNMTTEKTERREYSTVSTAIRDEHKKKKQVNFRDTSILAFRHGNAFTANSFQLSRLPAEIVCFSDTRVSRVFEIVSAKPRCCHGSIVPKHYE